MTSSGGRLHVEVVRVLSDNFAYLVCDRDAKVAVRWRTRARGWRAAPIRSPP